MNLMKYLFIVCILLSITAIVLAKKSTTQPATKPTTQPTTQPVKKAKNVNLSRIMQRVPKVLKQTQRSLWLNRECWKKKLAVTFVVQDIHLRKDGCETVSCIWKGKKSHPFPEGRVRNNVRGYHSGECIGIVGQLPNKIFVHKQPVDVKVYILMPHFKRTSKMNLGDTVTLRGMFIKSFIEKDKWCIILEGRPKKRAKAKTRYNVVRKLGKRTVRKPKPRSKKRGAYGRK